MSELEKDLSDVTAQTEAIQIPEVSRPLIIQIGIVVQQLWARKRKANRNNQNKSPRALFKWLFGGTAIVAIAGLAWQPIGKVVAERLFEPLIRQTYGRYINWQCGLSASLDRAATLKKAASDAWSKKDVRGFHRQYKEAVVIYEAIERDCESDEAPYELTIAHCEGYGTVKNVGIGKEYMAKLPREARLRIRRQQDPKFCQE